MKKPIFSSILFLLLLTNVATAHKAPVDEHAQFVPIPEYSPPKTGASAQASLNALMELLGMFDDSTKQGFMFELISPERQIWSNLPPSFVQRSGIAIDEMSDPQRESFFKFLSASLSEEGYAKIAHIIAAEAVLNGGADPKTSRYNPANYWFALYGTPSMKGDWGWQIDGHHLAMNIAVKNGVSSSMSPSFIGTEPAAFTINGVKYDEFVDMHQYGYAVYNSLTEDQKKLTSLKQAPNDVLAGANKDGFIPPVEGIEGSKLSVEQKKLLLKAIQQWVLLQADENSSKRMKEIASQLNETTFAWIGNGQSDVDNYFRIQGPTLIIELLLRASVNAPKGAEHYHTMYRNPTLEYGL